MTSRAQTPLVRGRSHSENLTFSALLCQHMYNEKERQTTKQKKHSRTSPDVQFKEFSLTKQKTRPKMNYEWIGKTISKKSPIQKIEKTANIKVKLPQVNKKPLARKRFFVQTPFSHSSLKLERIKFHTAKPLAFFTPFPVSV